MFRVIGKGIQVTVQDYPGRIGFAHLGFPPSGAMDFLALRAGNRIVGNKPGEAGIEFAFKGPCMECLQDCLISITGATSKPILDGKEIPMWTAVEVKKGQVLEFGYVSEGMWGYICLSGGVDVPEIMGSKSTFSKVKLGGFEGRELMPGDVIKSGAVEDSRIRKLSGKALKKEFIPAIPEVVEVDLMLGFYFDWLLESDIEKVYSAVWKIQPNSSRLGYRLEGPNFEFSQKAFEKPKACGSFPSNIFDTGYPVGGFNLAGQTPILLTADGPTAGGYMCPFIIASASLWKMGQCKLGGSLKFKRTNLEDSKKLWEQVDQYLSEAYYE